MNSTSQAKVVSSRTEALSSAGEAWASLRLQDWPDPSPWDWPSSTVEPRWKLGGHLDILETYPQSVFTETGMLGKWQY